MNWSRNVSEGRTDRDQCNGNNGFGRGKCANCKRVDSQINCFSRNDRIEIMVTDVIVWEVVETIRQQAWSGEHGEGKIYVLDIVEAVRVRTNEKRRGGS